jgi:hypothetical protein
MMKSQLQNSIWVRIRAFAAGFDFLQSDYTQLDMSFCKKSNRQQNCIRSPSEFCWLALKCLFFLFFLSACAPSSVEDFRYEGEALSRALTREMRQIQTREDLQASLPRLRKKFLKLSDLLLAAREFRSKHPQIEVPPPDFASDELFAELARLYELPGGRELIESAQTEAIEHLK